MSDRLAAPEPRGSKAAGSPTWWLVLSKELTELWLGGKALHLMLAYSLFLGLYAWLLATNTELNLMPLKEMVLEMVKAAVAVSMFICLIIGAESVSGERERLTLEGLLLTPASRRQIVIGKFLAALSPWPVALAIAAPYWYVVSQGDPVLDRALVWGGVSGTLLALAMAALGMLVSIWCNTNKASMVTSLIIYLLFLLPTTLAGPPKIQRSYELWFRAYLVEWVNPMAAVSRFLHRILLQGWLPGENLIWLYVPAVFAILVFVLLVQYGSPALRLEAETSGRFRLYWERLTTLWRMTGFASRSSAS